MAQEDSRKKVLVGLALQSDNQTPESAPTQYIIPAAAALMDGPRKIAEVKGENALHVLGAVPLAYNNKMSLAIFGYPDKAGLGEFLAAAIGPGSAAQQGGTSAYKHTFTPADVPPLMTIWQKEVAGEIQGGCMGINKLTLDVPNNSEMKATADILGSKIAKTSSFGTPTASDYPTYADGSKIFRSGTLTLTFGEAAAPVRTNIKDCKIEIDRGIKIEDGQTEHEDYPASVVPTQNLLTVDLEFLQTTLAELQRSWEGVATEPTATTHQATIGHPAANLKFIGPLIAGSYYYTLEIDIPYCLIKYVPAEKGSRRSGKITLTPVAGPASDPYTVYLTNTHTSDYAA